MTTTVCCGVGRAVFPAGDFSVASLAGSDSAGKIGGDIKTTACGANVVLGASLHVSGDILATELESFEANGQTTAGESVRLSQQPQPQQPQQQQQQQQLSLIHI